MGLDMYLTKKTYIGAKYEHRKVTGNIEISVNGELLPIEFKRISEICEDIGYWRKANQIHNWFVKNVQGGVDNCDEYEVSYEQLNQLLNDCKIALVDKGNAENILPTASGFFFGDTQYDEWYFKKLEDTIKIITPLLEEAKEYEGKKYLPETILYSSSW